MNSCNEDALLKSELGKARDLREFLLTAQITAPHGIKGEMKCNLLGNDKDALSDDQGLYLLTPQEKVLRRINLTNKGGNKSHAQIVTIDGINSREAAEMLKWHFIAKKRSEIQPLPDGRYYVCDLIGSKVIVAGEILGILTDIIQSTAQDVYVVKRKGKKDLLFPLTENTLQNVDINRGLIEVSLPNGLLEIYE